MHDRTVSPRWMNVILLVGIVAAALTPAAAGPTSALNERDVASATPGNGVANQPTINPTTFRRNVVWWPFANGPYYGEAPNAYARPSNLLVTPVGSFLTGQPLGLPSRLMTGLDRIHTGGAQYFLVQMRQEALNQPGWEQALLSTGAQIVSHEPVNGLILRLDSRAYGLVSSSPDIQFIEPYHAGYKLSPNIGTTPQLSPEAAASPLFNLSLTLFPGEPAAPLVDALSKMGLTPAAVFEPENGPGSAVIQLTGVTADKIVGLALLEPVEIVNETATPVLHGGRGSLYLQTTPGSGAFGDFTYWKVGLQGDGQIIQVTDSGLSVDAGDMTDQRTNSGWTGAGNNVLADHRKIVAYKGNNDACCGNTGDLLGCDTPARGAFTHGQVVSSVAAGGATRGYVPAPTNPNPTDACTYPNACAWNPNYTYVRDYAGLGFWFDALPQDGIFKESQDGAFDGVAKGAKIVFVDGSVTCPEVANPGISPGSIQNTIQNTWLTNRASIHNYSFGSNPGSTGPIYTSGYAQQTDTAVGNYPVNFVVFSAGNNGPVSGEQGSNLAYGNVSNDCVCKNCISAGASQGNYSPGGLIFDFTSEGPGPSKRHVVTVLGEGYDNACRSDEGTEDQTGVATCIDAGYSYGTSFAAPNLAGAAAVIREYFAEGFYPDGSNTNPGNAQDKVPWISARLVRALMIAGGQPISGVSGQSRFIPLHRFNHTWGWGQFYLSNALPIAAYSGKTVSGLIVKDVPGDISGDGTLDGVSSLGLADTIPSGTFETTAEFQVLNTNEDLRVALVWDDPANTTGAVDNDLDLEVRDCGADGVCNNSDDTVWNGDAFTEDYNEDGTLNEPDLNGDGRLTGYWYTISDRDVTTAVNPGVYNNYRNHLDNMEGVFVATKIHAPDLDTNGTADIRYLDDFQGDRGAGCSQTSVCPRTGKWQIKVKRYSGTVNPLRYAVAIAGPVAAGSSVRFDTNPQTCNGDEDVIVNETDDPADLNCHAGACPASRISSRTTVKVFHANDLVNPVDQETGLSFVNDPPGSLNFRLANRMPVSAVTAAAGPVFGDGVLSAGNTDILKVYYDDWPENQTKIRTSEAVIDCQPAIDVFVIRQLGPDTPFLLAGGCDDDRYLDANEEFSLTVQYFNTDPFLLVDTVATLSATDPVTGSPSPYISLNEPGFAAVSAAKAVGELGSQTLQRTSFGFKVVGTPPARQKVNFNVCISSEKAGQGIGSCTTFQFLLQADDEKHFYITDCPTGCANVKFDRNNDEKIETLVKTNPFFDVMDHIHRNLSEIVTYEDMTVDNTAGWPSTPVDTRCPSCGNVGFNGPWNFDASRQGFKMGRDADSKKTSQMTTLPTNWGGDSNWNDIYEPALNETGTTKGGPELNWGTTGGCGWMSKGTATTGGVWHTGTIGSWAAAHQTTMCGGGTRYDDNICERYDVEVGTAGTAYWWEALRSPTIHPTRFGTDPDGFGWKTRILDWSWNMQSDDADFNAHGTSEFDLDLNDGQQSVLGDMFIQKNYGQGSGLITGGQLDLYGGGYAFAQTCRPKAGTTTCAGSPTPGYGDERNGTIGGNRAGKRGCYFNDLNLIPDGSRTAAERMVRTPKDDDDDCDNNYNLGPDGAPGVRGVDDDGNGLIDDPAEICPCFRCTNGPRANMPCSNNPSFCNPTGGTTYTCDLSVNANGVPTAYGDDICGDGTTDPWVSADWNTGTSQIRQRRNADLSMLNGVASAGRYAGDIYYNNLEDYYGPPGHDWGTELGFIVQEPDGSTSAVLGYGMAVDDMVIEWQETHPVAQTIANKCDVSQAYYAANGQCAQIALGSAYNTGTGDKEIPIALVDPVPGVWPNGNLGQPPCGADQIRVTAYSGIELAGENYCLTRVNTSDEFRGLIKTTTRVNVSGDGYVYAAYDGTRYPVVTVRYVDMDDGTGPGPSPSCPTCTGHRWGYGVDGQPGVAGFDDDGDGTIDNESEHCSDKTQFAEGRTPHLAGTPARWSDDTCGCLYNPITANINNYYDVVDVVVGDVTVRDGVAGVGKGDGDGFLDKKEEVVLDVKVRNLSNFPVENLELTLATTSPLIECMIKDRLTIPRLEKHLVPGDEYDTVSGSEHFSFVVGAGADRVNPGDDMKSEWTVTVRGLAKAGLDTSFKTDLPIEGTAIVQSFKLQHNLNAPTVTRDVDFVDNMESYTTDATAVCTPAAGQSRCTTAPYIKRVTGDDLAELKGTHCQINDPNNPYGNNTAIADFCELGEGYVTENHWHLQGPGSNTCEQTNGCPDGGRGHSGQRSLASGAYSTQGANNYHAFDNNITSTFNRMYWLKTRDNYQLGTGKTLHGSTPVQCNSNPASCADQSPVFEYWTQMSLYDFRLFGDAPPMAWDAGLVYLCVDKNNNSDCDTKEDGLKDGSEKWEPLHAYYSPESGFRMNNWINCMYDPSDDGNTERDFFNGSTSVGPSSTCYPESSDTCVGATDYPSGSDQFGLWVLILDYSCWPETGQEGLEGELGSFGVGKWIKKLYNLKQYRGQKALFRWHVAPGALKGWQRCDDLGPGCYNLDDGWFVDDVRIYGRATPFALTNDNTVHTPGGVCPTSPASGLQARVAVVSSPRNFADGKPKPAIACTDPQLAYCDFDQNGVVDAMVADGKSDAPGRPYFLDARYSTAATCNSGALEFEFTDQSGNVLRAWNTGPQFVVDPEQTTTYVLNMRCTSDISVVSSVTVTINTCVDPIKLTATKVDDNTTRLNWTGAASFWDVASGNLSTLLASGNFSGATCAKNHHSLTTSDEVSHPATGDGTWWLVRVDNASWNDGYTCGQAGTGGPAPNGRDTTLTVCP